MENKHSGTLGTVFLIGAAALAVVFRNTLPVVSLILIVLAGGFLLLLGVIIFFAFYKPRLRPEEARAVQAAEQLQGGRSALVTLRMRCARIRDGSIREVGGEVCERISAVLATLKEQPEDMNKAGMLFSYYIPTVDRILLKYEQLERGGFVTEDILATTAACLSDVKSAMEKMNTKLFEDDILDLSVEMSTLTQMCKRQGLLTDGDLSVK